MNAWLVEYAWLWQLAGWTMIHFLWLGSLAAILGAALRSACRRAAPNVRYAASLLTLAVLAAMPLAIAAWLATNPAPIELAATRRSAAAERAGAERAAPDPSFVIPHSDFVIPHPTPSSVIPHSDFAIPTPPPPSFVIPHSDFVILNSLVPYLPWAWLVGAPLTFLLLAAGLVGSQRLRRDGTPLVDGPAFDACRRLRTALGMTCHVSLAACVWIAQPVLIGIARPLILLPAAALAGWTPAELEMVLLHELAHVRRADNLVNLVQRLIESLLFFHPAVWLASRQVRRDREECCDAIVVARTERPREYAELLVSIAATLRGRTTIGSLAAASAMADHPLAGRLRRILKLENEPMRVSSKTIAAAFLAPLLIATAALYAVAESSPNEEQPSTTPEATAEEPTDTAAPPTADPATKSDQSPAQKVDPWAAPNPRARTKEQLAKAVAAEVAALKIEMELQGQLHSRYEMAKGQAIGGHDAEALLYLLDAEAYGDEQVRDIERRRLETQRAIETAANQPEPAPGNIKELALQRIELTRQRDKAYNAAANAAEQRYRGHAELVLERSVEAAAELKKSIAANKAKLKQLQERLARLQQGIDDQTLVQIESGVAVGEAVAPGQVLATVPAAPVREADESPSRVPSDLRHEKTFPPDTPFQEIAAEVERLTRAGRAVKISRLDDGSAVVVSAASAPPALADAASQPAVEVPAARPLRVFLAVPQLKSARTPEERTQQQQELLALVRSPQVTSSVLQSPEVAQLGSVKAQPDAAAWLAARLLAEFPGDGLELNIGGATYDGAQLLEMKFKDEGVESDDRVILKTLFNVMHAAVFARNPPPLKGGARGGIEPAADPPSPPEVSVIQWPVSVGGQTTAYLRVKLPSAGLSRQEMEKNAKAQLALVESPKVIERALRTPELQMLFRVNDPPKWVAERVRVSFPGDGEIIQLRIESVEPMAENDRKLLTALINSYLAEVKTAGGGDALAREEAEQAARPVFLYDGKTFDQWRSQWKHELKIERRIEAIDALAAFARAGYAEQAAEAILDVAGEYDFSKYYFGDESTEGKLRDAIVGQLWSTKFSPWVWLPILFERLEADPKKWQPLAHALLRHSTYWGPDRPLDDESLRLLINMASDPKYGPNAAVLSVLKQGVGKDAKVDRLITDSLSGDDANNALQVLALMGFKDLEMFPGQVDLLFHKDAEVRRAARTTLSGVHFGELEAVADRLLKILDDPEQSANHADAIRALGVLQNYQSKKGEVNAENPRYSKGANQKVWRALMRHLKDGPAELLPPVLVALGGDSPEYARSMTTGDQLSPERKAEIESAFAKYPQALEQATAHGE